MTSPAHTDLLTAVEALLEQYDFGAGTCLGVTDDGKPRFYREASALPSTGRGTEA